MKTDGMTSDEASHTNEHKKSYLKIRLGFAGTIAILLSILICTSCRQGAHKASYRTTEEAVNDYAQFLIEVKKRDKISMESLLTGVITQTYVIITYIAGVLKEKIDFKCIDNLFSEYGFDIKEYEIELNTLK